MPRRLHGAAAYGDSNAAVYDQLYPRIDPQVIDCLTVLAAGRPVLALGVGTGRCAAGLLARGVKVCGVDGSAAMLQRCRRRLPGLPLIRADLAMLPIRGGFGLAYSLVSTLSLLTTAEAQQRCLAGIAAALDPGGIYVDESTLVATSTDTLSVDCALPQFAPALRYRVRYLPLTLARLDQMAELAGLRLLQRWRTWRRQPFRPGDTEAISIYQRA